MPSSIVIVSILGGTASALLGLEVTYSLSIASLSYLLGGYATTFGLLAYRLTKVARAHVD